MVKAYCGELVNEVMHASWLMTRPPPFSPKHFGCCKVRVMFWMVTSRWKSRTITQTSR
jgi:hypothetical protein